MDRASLETPLATSLSDSHTDPIQVLHVDDDAAFADMTATFLEREHDNITVVTATSTDAGLSILADEPIECIVSDYNMPETNGLDFLELVRESHPALPFILFTGRGSEEIASEAISRGVTDYMQKETGTDQFTVLANRIDQSVRHRRVERAIEQTHERYRLLVEESTDVILVLSPEGTVEYASPAASPILGRDASSLIGTSAFELIHPDDKEAVLAEFAGLIEDPEARRSAEFRYRRTDGSWVWMEARGRNLLDDPMLEGLLVYTREITDRKAHEQELAETTHTLGAVVEASPLPIIAVDDDGRTLLWNSAATDMFEWTAEEILGDPFPVVPERKKTEARTIVDRALDGTAITGMTVHRRTKTGDELELLLSTAPIYDANGEISGVMAVFSEIPERERALEALHGATRRLIEARDPAEIAERTVAAIRDILDIPITACWLYDEHTETLEPVAWTDEAHDLLGDLPHYRADEPSLSWQAFEHGVPQSIDDVSIEPRAANPKTPLRDELILPLGAHGVINIGSTTAGRFSELDVSLAKLVADTAETVLSRAAREAELRDEQDRFRAVFEKASDAMMIADETGTYIDANQSACELFGYAKSDLVGRSIEEFAPEKYDFEETWTDFLEAGQMRGTFPLVQADGSTRILEYAATANIVPGQHLSILRDINEEREQKRELQRQNERLNEFASIVSHDLRNPLNILSGSLDFAEETGRPEEFERSRHAIRRMETLIEDLLALAREGELVSAFDAVSIATLAHASWNSVDTADATFHLETTQSILADESRARQLFENLIRNAIDHGGPAVEVTVGDLDDGFYLADTGPGIPATERDAVFEPGYSTHSGGTGYGLAIVAQIATAHHWDVAVTESEDGGARFEVTNVTIVEE